MAYLHAREMLPRITSDWIAFIVAIVLIHIVVVYEVVVILPYIDEERTRTFWLHVAFGLFLYVSVITSFVRTIATNSTTRHMMLPSVLKPGWRFCSVCEANAPPRSKHCWMCDVCVLKRDHHCIFTGNCIGYNNQRYFINFLLYLSVGAFYCNFLNVDYTIETLGNINLLTLFTILLPMLSWVFGVAPAYTFAVAFISMVCLLGFLLVTGYLIYQLRNIYCGQTMWETASGTKDYNFGWRENMMEVFGQSYILAFFSPFVKSPLLGDGLEFKKKYNENVKDL